MQISDQEESIIDFDWFAIDKEVAIGSFITGGWGAMPRSVAASAEDLKTITEYFKNCLAPIGSPLVNEDFVSFVKLREGETAKATYLKHFIKMASQGLYSYDCLYTGKRPTGYFQVAAPSVVLLAVNLPAGTYQILERTVFKEVCFRTSDRIAYETIERVS